MALPVSLVEDDCESTDAAKLFAIADAFGSRRVSEARVAAFADDFLVFIRFVSLRLDGLPALRGIAAQQPAVDGVVKLWPNALPPALSVATVGFGWCEWLRFGLLQLRTQSLADTSSYLIRGQQLTRALYVVPSSCS